MLISSYTQKSDTYVYVLSDLERNKNSIIISEHLTLCTRCTIVTYDCSTFCKSVLCLVTSVHLCATSVANLPQHFLL